MQDRRMNVSAQHTNTIRNTTHITQGCTMRRARHTILNTQNTVHNPQYRTHETRHTIQLTHNATHNNTQCTTPNTPLKHAHTNIATNQNTTYKITQVLTRQHIKNIAQRHTSISKYEIDRKATERSPTHQRIKISHQTRFAKLHLSCRILVATRIPFLITHTKVNG